MSDLIRADAIAEAYRLGLTHGGAHLLEVATAYGWTEASEHIAADVDVTMSADEQEILYDALQRIVALRIAPADLSALPAPSEAASGCHRPGCAVCAAAAPSAVELPGDAEIINGRRILRLVFSGTDPRADFAEFLSVMDEDEERAVAGWMLGNLPALVALLTSRLAEIDREAA